MSNINIGMLYSQLTLQQLSRYVGLISLRLLYYQMNIRCGEFKWPIAVSVSMLIICNFSVLPTIRRHDNVMSAHPGLELPNILEQEINIWEERKNFQAIKPKSSADTKIGSGSTERLLQNYRTRPESHVIKGCSTSLPALWKVFPVSLTDFYCCLWILCIKSGPETGSWRQKIRKLF